MVEDDVIRHYIGEAAQNLIAFSSQYPGRTEEGCPVEAQRLAGDFYKIDRSTLSTLWKSFYEGDDRRRRIEGMDRKGDDQQVIFSRWNPGVHGFKNNLVSGLFQS